MVPIPITEFVKQTVAHKPKTDAASLTANCREMLEKQRSGAGCIICGNLIWAAGSAITGTPMCFTCMTGEVDDSEDYEIEEKIT